jgi:enamine deaminase RidA (YjgF/YER057c/UK114 family)
MSETISLVTTDKLSAAAQYAYAASVAPGARLIFLAGACPLNIDGSTAGVGSFTLQAGKAVENLLIALEESGAGLADIVFTRVLVASDKQDDLVAAWNVVRKAFGNHGVPSTLMGVTVLGYDDQLVEIEAVAAVSDSAVPRQK